MTAGCAETGGAAAFVIALAVLGAAGCASRQAPPDALAEPDARVGGPDARAGHCEPCCGFAAEFGYCGSGTASCFCPAGVACNYAFGCIDGGSLLDAGPAADSGGTDEPCCMFDDGGLLGAVSSCFCPAGTACGFAPFLDCGDGTCVVGDAGACPLDAGT